MAPVGTKRILFHVPGQPPEECSCKHGSCTAAAASAGMGVLRGVVIDQKSAVLMDFADINMLFKKKILKDPLAYHPQISGKNSVVILRGAAEIIKILPYGIAAAGAMQPPILRESWKP